MLSIKDIVEFNQIAGNEFKKREYSEDLPRTYMNLIEEEFIETMSAYWQGDLEEIVDGACDLIVVCTGLLYSLGINPEEALKAVTTANNSKWCDNEEDAQESVRAYENDERYFDVYYEKVRDKYVIKGRKADSDGDGLKILKGINTYKPDFKKVLQQREEI